MHTPRRHLQRALASVSAKRSATVRVLLIGILLLCWVVPLVWVTAIAVRPPHIPVGRGSSLYAGAITAVNFEAAWRVLASSYLNTIIMVFGTLAVQLVTIFFAGYAFARIQFPGRELIFRLVLIQIMIPLTALIIPNFFIIRALGLYDSVFAVMVPYFGSAFGTFLLRQTFLDIPDEFEEAAAIDGASLLQVLVRVYLPLVIPGMAAFSFASIVYRWNDFLLPLLVTADRATPLSVRLNLLAASEGGIQWPVLAAATILIILPLLLLFSILQRAVVASLSHGGLK